MSEPNVHAFPAELEQLGADVARMGGLAEAQVAEAVGSVARRDVTLAQAVVQRDEKLDALQAGIDAKVVRLIAARRLDPAEVRQALAAMKLAHELERIGDLARNIGRRAMVIAQSEPVTLTRSMERMGKLVAGRLRVVLDACTAGDAARALQVWGDDEEVDEHYNSLFRELLTYMMGDPRMISPCAHLLFVGKNLERIGDHATNVAEIVYHQITGEQIFSERPKAVQIGD